MALISVTRHKVLPLIPTLGFAMKSRHWVLPGGVGDCRLGWLRAMLRLAAVGHREALDPLGPQFLCGLGVLRETYGPAAAKAE
jgi:hypothetical protein